MKKPDFLKATALLLLVLGSFSATAQEDPTGPKELIENTTTRVLQVLEKHKARQDEKENQAMASEMLQALEPAVNFEVIALGIMGKHRNAATEDQKQRFAKVLKDTLAQLYVESFNDINIQNVEVLDLPPDFVPETATEASVQMRTTMRSGETYTLTYSMRRSNTDGWQVLNILANGVNLGLIFRSQFNDLMSRYQDIDKVIDAWSSEVEADEAAAYPVTSQNTQAHG